MLFIAMERVAMERAVVESVRHPPALYWGVVSAAALCSVWGTFHLANRSKRSREPKVNSGFHAFKRLRRQYAVNLRPILEDLVYLTMFLFNLMVGVFYWIMDKILDGRRTSSTPQLVVSSILVSCADSDDFWTVEGADAFPKRRGQIKRLRPRWAWARTAWAHSMPKSNFRQRCECWGWTVKDLAPEDILTCNGSEILIQKLDSEPASLSSQVKISRTRYLLLSFSFLSRFFSPCLTRCAVGTSLLSSREVAFIETIIYPNFVQYSRAFMNF